MRKFIAIKEKVSLHSNQITFNYNQKCHPLHLRDTWYQQFPKKKASKKKEGEGKEIVEEGGKKEGKGKKRDGKEEKKRKGWQEFVRNERKKEEGAVAKKEKEGEGEERRGREKITGNGENGARGAPPSPDAFPSAKLGNNMTPIKGRLGKNTTPISRSPTKPNQNLHLDPRRRRSSLEVSSRANLIYTP